MIQNINCIYCRYGSCKEMYLTRTGSFKNQPNKCVAVAVVQSGHESIVQQSHRTGFTALKTDQYTNDFPIDYSGEKKDLEMNLMKPFLEEYDSLVSEFLKKMGSPIDEATGQRKLAIVMVANELVTLILLSKLVFLLTSPNCIQGSNGLASEFPVLCRRNQLEFEVYYCICRRREIHFSSGEYGSKCHL